MAMSMPELALLLVVLLGVPVLSIRIVRSGPTDDLARPLKFLHGAFWGAILSFALAMSAGYLQTVPSGVVYNFLLAAFYVCACFYWTAVAVLSHRLRRSWILWLAIGLATLAIGFFATYILLAIRARKELAPTGKSITSERSSTS